MNPHLISSKLCGLTNTYVNGKEPVLSISFLLTQVIFAASRGESFEGDIAIDDVMFYDGLCPKGKVLYSILVKSF